jgi:hypothetical protein
VNKWRFEICVRVGQENERRADMIIDTLRESDRAAGRIRLGEFAGGCWPLDFGTTELEQEAARRKVVHELIDIDVSALEVLDVRPAG